jgi:hypothetical protein
MRVLTHTASRKDSYLHKASKRTIAVIASVAAGCGGGGGGSDGDSDGSDAGGSDDGDGDSDTEDPTRGRRSVPGARAAVLSALLGPTGHRNFDNVTGTRAAATVLANMKASEVATHAADVAASFSRSSTGAAAAAAAAKKGGKGGKAAKGGKARKGSTDDGAADAGEQDDQQLRTRRQLWAASRLSDLAKSRSLPRSRGVVTAVLTFLLVNGFFRYTGGETPASVNAVLTWDAEEAAAKLGTKGSAAKKAAKGKKNDDNLSASDAAIFEICLRAPEDQAPVDDAVRAECRRRFLNLVKDLPSIIEDVSGADNDAAEGYSGGAVFFFFF